MSAKVWCVFSLSHRSYSKPNLTEATLHLKNAVNGIQRLTLAHLAALYQLDKLWINASIFKKKKKQQPFINLPDTNWRQLLYHLLWTQDQQHPL